MTLAHLLGPASSLPLGGFILRSIVIYFSLLLFTRLSGRREVARLDAYSFVVAVTVGSIASPPLARADSSVVAALAAIILFYTLHLILFYLEQSSPVLAKLFGDEPLVLVENGKLVEDNMMKAHYNTDNLLMQLRLKQIPSLSDVEFAVLEPSGDISVVPKSQSRPVTPADLGMSPPGEGWPLTLIADGRINAENLAAAGHDEQWLRDVLRAKGIVNDKDVLYMAVDRQGNVYVDYIRPTQWQYLR